uniref:Uncharacterized protein n=1 Tax=Anguilla anguilla TaxID=7936 RepID=A0A0E9XRQ9_ANGAN
MCILKVILPPRPKIKHLHTHSYCIYQKNVFHEISCKNIKPLQKIIIIHVQCCSFI